MFNCVSTFPAWDYFSVDKWVDYTESDINSPSAFVGIAGRKAERRGM
jgi:hypothetical protein